MGQSETAGHRSSARRCISIESLLLVYTPTTRDTHSVNAVGLLSLDVWRREGCPPCPTTSCVEKLTLPYLTLQRDVSLRHLFEHSAATSTTESDVRAQRSAAETHPSSATY